jgi:putative transposase
MPSKNALKEYEAGGYYHVYNRGVAKSIVFLDDKDFKTFLSYLEFYLTPINLQGQSSKVSPSRVLNNYCGEITLIAYCLMPNHFHLLLRQNTEHGMDHFMRSLITKYVRYFNTRYERVGHLFQARYKAVRVTSEDQFTYLTKYIHRHPLDLSTFKDCPRRLSEYKFSSYGNYLHNFVQRWVSCDDVLSYFSKTNPRCSYQSFVEESDPDDVALIATAAIDLE